MGTLSISHQTLQEFIDAPFGKKNIEKNLKYDTRYQKYKKENKIKMVASIELDKNYFIHLQVPSESQKGTSYYDVVIQFFTTDARVERQTSVINYHVQFFSNSPGFVYKYAALYKLEGYLIESLYDKFDKGTLDILPDRANKNYELYFDSSIYYASKYLLDNQLHALLKFNLKMFHHRTVENFFGSIQDTESVHISKAVSSLEKSLHTEIEKDMGLSTRNQQKLKQNKVFAHDVIKKKEKILSKKNTVKDANDLGIKRISASKPSKNAAKVIKGKKSTRKR